MQYMVSYDQHHDRNYQPVWDQLRRWNAKRVLESVWFVESHLTAGQIRDQLQQTTRNEDSLVVVQLSPNANWATYRAQTEGVTWLQKNIAA